MGRSNGSKSKRGSKAKPASESKQGSKSKRGSESKQGLKSKQGFESKQTIIIDTTNHRPKGEGGDLTIQMKPPTKTSQKSKLNWNWGFLSMYEKRRMIKQNLRGMGKGRTVPGSRPSVNACVPAFPDSTAEMFYILNHIHTPEMFPFTEPVKAIWNESIEEVKPTFKTALDYVKILLVKRMKHPKVKGLPQSPCSLENAIREKANEHQLRNNEIMKKFETMSCTEEARYLSHLHKRTKEFHLKWFRYYKNKPKVFQKLCDPRQY
ncbi:hypothetical protein R5R35_005050 [Gryllus longicercus]|uniref:Uncharacterized protein n=1 Tax=Gryllus longicercus TaxID=2509291 RepID=A0AAN9VXV1_9ORTH